MKIKYQLLILNQKKELMIIQNYKKLYKILNFLLINFYKII